MERLREACHKAKNAVLDSDISWRTYCLIICFALSSWITVNGIWSELPVIILYLPEKWKIASYTVVIIQVGFAGPILFSLANKFYPRIFTEKFTIYLLYVIGILSMLFLAIWFKKTTTIGGSPHSLAFMLLVFALSFVDCTSTVVFLTFMAAYDPRYLTALYIGESLCGLLPGIAALIQGTPTYTCNSTNFTSQNNSNAHSSDAGLLFSASSYFFILLAMLFFSASAFLALNCLPFAQQEQKFHATANPISEVQNTNEFTDTDELISEEPASQIACRSSCLSDKRFIGMFFIQAIVSSLTFGILPALSPYIFEPYGNVAYHLAASLSPVVCSLVCFFIIWYQRKSWNTLVVTFAIFLFGSVYEIILASQSPRPWLYDSHVGSVIVILVGLLVSLLSVYIRLTVSIIMREESKKALYWCGMSTQIGSFVGAFSIFPFVSVLHYFHEKQTC